MAVVANISMKYFWNCQVGFIKSCGQPALLYLVPFILVPAVVISYRRKEFSEMWRGIRVKVETEDEERTGDDEPLIINNSNNDQDDDRNL